MSGPVLYSTNPWFSLDIALRYRKGVHFAWVSEYFDGSTAAAGSAAAQIAPSSTPKIIYQRLQQDCLKEENHSFLLKGYKKTFARLAREWLSDGSISKDECEEIVASARAQSWRNWRPVLYVIPRAPIESAGRLMSVKRKQRAGHGPEQQVRDLRRDEFDVIEF